MPTIVVDVMLKPEILDPQGRAVQGALRRLGLQNVWSVRQGKRFEIEIEGELDEPLDAQLRELAGTLLSNPVIEDWNLYVAGGPEQPADQSEYEVSPLPTPTPPVPEVPTTSEDSSASEDMTGSQTQAALEVVVAPEPQTEPEAVVATEVQAAPEAVTVIEAQAEPEFVVVAEAQAEPADVVVAEAQAKPEALTVPELEAPADEGAVAGDGAQVSAGGDRD